MRTWWSSVVLDHVATEELMPGIYASAPVDTLEWHTVTIHPGDEGPYFTDCKKQRYDGEGFKVMPPYGFLCQECRLQRMWIDG
jgi:hypothetical protein